MSNLPTDRNNNSVTPFNFFNLFDQLENMVINSFQSALAPINNTAFEDKGNEYVFTLTLKNLKREDIQLNVENQQLILTIHQSLNTTEDSFQSYQSQSFSQAFSLYDVDVDQITATLKDDTLTIILPKLETVVLNLRTIDIK